MDIINYATYLDRLKKVRIELMLLESMSLNGKVCEPSNEGDADDALAQYAMLALQTVNALEQCGRRDWAEIRKIAGDPRWTSKVAGQESASS